MKNSDPNKELSKLIKIVKTLRGPNGCKWDKAQTHQSLTPYLLEEAYEVIESIDEYNLQKLKEELGDLLLHIVFQAELGEEKGNFTLTDSIKIISKKLVRRHPHVFSDTEVNSIKEIKKNWEEIKLKEGRTSLMEGLPKTLPALLQAQRVQLRASEVGFDWEKIDGVWDKVLEELKELKEATETKNHEKIRNELGDLLFSLVNLSRFLNVNTEEALRGTVKKFVNRFKSIEEELSSNGVEIKNSSLSKMDQLWNKIKTKEKL
ncbi:MAG: nucleoside triphosphate pyrophosphohydrolase [Candidatus Marinimicrobia bacterium]|nr:nucleoside triphosphate pyrophosphohydrolase [Candidatus Neomarinimicrobiota bacterium]